jgi:hypothetical protein
MHDLDTLDTVTLRTWRAMNLVGWAVAGMTTTVILGAAGSAIAGRLYEEGHAWANLLSLLWAMVAGATGGAVIGAKVYRWPGATTFIAASVVWLGWFAWESAGSATSFGAAELAIQWMFSMLAIIPAVLAARLVWRGRPAGLRAVSG